MSDGRQHVVRISLRGSQVLENGGHRGGTHAIYILRRLLVGHGTANGGVRGFTPFQGRGHNHVKIELLRFHILNAASVKGGKRAKTAGFFVASSWWVLRSTNTRHVLHLHTVGAILRGSLSRSSIAHVDLFSSVTNNLLPLSWFLKLECLI